MKIFKHRNILGFIYSLFLLLPFFNVLGRVCYVTINKNAHLSYSDSIIDKTELVSSNSNLSSGLTYYLQWDSSINGRGDGSKIWYSDITIDWSSYGAPSGVDYVAFSTYYASDNTRYTYLFNDSSSSAYFVFWSTIDFADFYFTVSKDVQLNGVNDYSLYFISKTFDTLDNAFDYSLNKITNNNLGNVKWFNFIGNLFLDDNSQNNLYINFINWYMNYALLVSVVYVLFMVLMWFIQWIRRLLERGLDKFGGGGSY